MTTGSNKIDQRLKSENGEEKELTTGIPVDGFADPTGEFPRRYNWFSSSVSQAGRGVKINDLWMSGSSLGTSFDIPVPTTSIFPFNNANETPSGHSFEMDDTPGNERILIKHHTGAGVELKQDGSVLLVSRTHQVQVVGGDHELIVQGEGNLTYDGDLNLTVNGNYNLDVGGTMNVTVGANHNHSVHGTYITETGDTHQTIVRGNMDTKVWGDRVDYGSSEHKIITKGDLRFLSGNDIIPNAKRGIRMTAEGHITGSSGGFMTWSAHDMRVIGEKGRIGGEKFQYFGEVYTGGSDGQGKDVVFHGNLVGRALEAWTAKYAKFSEEAHTSFFAGTAQSIGVVTSPPSMTIPPNYKFEWGWNAKKNCIVYKSVEFTGASFTNDDPDFQDGLLADGFPDSKVPHEPMYDNAVPSKGQWEMWQKASPYAVRIVRVDEDDILEDKIAKNDTYSYYFNWTPSTPEIRAKLRTMDGAADASTSPELQTDGPKCIASLLDENRLNALYSVGAPPAPYEVTRTGQSEPTPRFGYTLLGNPVERASKTFTPKNKVALTRTILADPVYNPDKHDAPITSGTRLSKSATLSKFFGAPGSKSSLDFVPIVKQRQDLARQYYLHAWLMEGVANAKEFRNFRLQVTEGYYNPANGLRRKFNGKEEPATRRYWREPYRKADGGSCQTSIVKGSPFINELKYEGRAVVYTLYNSRGKTDYAATFDLSLFIRDTFFFDQLSLDYDITRPDGVMSQQLIVVMPKIYKDFKATFEQKVCTYFNRQMFSGSDLVEITD